MIPRQLANKLPEKRFHWPAKMRVILLERTTPCGAARLQLGWGESFSFKFEDDTHGSEFFFKKNKALETPSERSK
jgi:hypothetical protein